MEIVSFYKCGGPKKCAVVGFAQRPKNGPPRGGGPYGLRVPEPWRPVSLLRGREAPGHQEAGGLEDIVGVPEHTGPGGHVLLVELL